MIEREKKGKLIEHLKEIADEGDSWSFPLSPLIERSALDYLLAGIFHELGDDNGGGIFRPLSKVDFVEGS